MSIHHGLFEDGESPLKESRDIELYNTMFKWKYPLWYAHHIRLYDCSLFEMALERITENKVCELDDERKAQMVSNLLVVLCGNKDAQPIVNSGSIY